MSTDIFLSYAREDASKAMELARILEKDGWTVWWDKEITPGQDFETEIDMALSNAKAVVVLWSAYSVASNWVRSEAREAKEANKLIPVQLDQSRIPLSYRSLTTIDLSNWPDQQSLVEISMFKSAISRVLLKGVSGQMLKKPLVTDEMTLSVRVASRVAEMVGKQGGETASSAQDASLAVERCITDICLDLLVTPHNALEARLDAYVTQLAAVLKAPRVVCHRVNFARMHVSNVRSLVSVELSSADEKVVMEYVNEYCSPLGEHNMHLSPGKWPCGKVLCLPMNQGAGGREFAWFIAEDPTTDWTQQLQERILKLATGIQARSRGIS